MGMWLAKAGKNLFSLVFSFCICQLLYAIPLAEQLAQTGYAEICTTHYGAAGFDALYTHFDELITFLQTNPAWKHKLYRAKERFIRSSDCCYYSTDFVGFYDESDRADRRQISCYYSTHFHTFLYTRYPEFMQIPEITRFFEACRIMQEAYQDLFDDLATKLGITTIFSSPYGRSPLLFKIIKYLPSYRTTRPHYDGTAFSLLLDSTDNQSLLLAPYQPSLTIDDFFAPLRSIPRGHQQHSMLLILGTLLTEFSLYPTPHFVTQSGKTRYAAIAFAMRPYHTPPQRTFAPLPPVT